MKVDLKKFLKKDEELRAEHQKMRLAMLDEIRSIIENNGNKVLFDAVEDPSDGSRLVKGFRIKDGRKEILLEDKSKPMISLYNPYGNWFWLPEGYGFKTIRNLAAYIEILRNAVNK